MTVTMYPMAVSMERVAVGTCPGVVNFTSIFKKKTQNYDKLSKGKYRNQLDLVFPEPLRRGFFKTTLHMCNVVLKNAKVANERFVFLSYLIS